MNCEARPVRMAVASSLREMALEIRRDLAAGKPPIEVELIFGASSTLARQLALGAPIDILVSADAEIVNDLVARDLIVPGSRREFARGQLVLVARADSFEEGAGLAALDSPELRRIAIPAESVPLGRYARSWLASLGTLSRLEGRIVSTEHARATLTAVEAGHADLAIVYSSDALLARHARVIARIDASEHPPIRYVVALTTTAGAASGSCPSIGETLAAWTARPTRDRLVDSGFLPVAGTSSPFQAATTPSSRTFGP